jgi:hypothetical protein
MTLTFVTIPRTPCFDRLLFPLSLTDINFELTDNVILQTQSHTFRIPCYRICFKPLLVPNSYFRLAPDILFYFSKSPIKFPNFVHILAKHVCTLHNDYTRRLVQRKLHTKPLETLPLISVNLSCNSKLGCDPPIDLEPRSNFIKFPANAKPQRVMKGIPKSGCTRYQPVQQKCQRLPEIPFPSNTFNNSNCALLRTVKLTRSRNKPYLTPTPPLTAPSEINSRPPTSIRDYRKSAEDILDHSQAKSDSQNAKEPPEKLFVFAAFRQEVQNAQPVSKKQKISSVKAKYADEIVGAPISSVNSEAPKTKRRRSQTYYTLSPQKQSDLTGRSLSTPVPGCKFSQENNQAEQRISVAPALTIMKAIAPNKPRTQEPTLTLTAYKPVAKKVRPVSTQLPEEYYIHRCIPEDPLLTLPVLSFRPPKFVPTRKITNERMELLDVNSNGFLWPEEEKLFKHIMVLNEQAIAFEDTERGTLKESYFSPYIIPTIPHIPWECRHIPIPPGLRDKVMDVLRLKIAAGVYEQSSSSYRSPWFVTMKKNGKLRIVHDLQPLNGITIRDAGMLPVLDDFVESFAGRQCYTVFDLFWGFDARKIHPKAEKLLPFLHPLEHYSLPHYQPDLLILLPSFRNACQ